MSDALQYSRQDLRHALPTSAEEREGLVYIGACSIATVYESISSLKGSPGKVWGYSLADALRPLWC
ncbi:MAG TPA: hypothetical protein VF043_05165 [Ktedonobacteraceae bacterium]